MAAPARRRPDRARRLRHRLRADPARGRGAGGAADASRVTAPRYYHGGMAARARAPRHEEFLADQVPIMVATSAFGMGIDKPNIRWVAHVALPDSPDSYLQEIGRAGRDGLPGPGCPAVPGRGRGPCSGFSAGGARPRPRSATWWRCCANARTPAPNCATSAVSACAN